MPSPREMHTASRDVQVKQTGKQTFVCFLVVREITLSVLFLAAAQVMNMTQTEFKHPVSHGPDGII